MTVSCRFTFSLLGLWAVSAALHAQTTWAKRPPSVTAPSALPAPPIFPVPSGKPVYYVAPNLADNVGNGTSASPWSLKRAVGLSGAPAGSVVLLKNGVYSAFDVDVKNSLVIQPEPGAQATLRGTLKITSWTSAGNGLWWCSTNTDGNTGNGYELEFAPASLDDPRDFNPLAGDREQVIQNGNPLVQAASLSEVQNNSGRFWVDRTNHRIYLKNGATNPGSGDVQITRGLRGLNLYAAGTSGEASGSVVRGLTFLHYGESGVEVQAANVTIEGNVAAWCSVNGMKANGRGGATSNGNLSGIQFLNNHFVANGMAGLTVFQTQGILVKGNSFSQNNVEGFYTDQAAAGFKITGPFSSGAQIRENRATGNFANGLWLDIGTDNASVLDNRCEGNDIAGIFFEISNTATLGFNLCRDNGSGIMVANSQNATILNNTLVENDINLRIRKSNRPQNESSGTVGGVPPGAIYPNAGHRVWNNLLANGRAASYTFPDGTTRQTSLFDAWECGNSTSEVAVVASNFNGYSRSGATPSQFVGWRNGSGGFFADLAAFRAYQGGIYEQNGVSDLSGGPLFVGGGNYRPLAGSIALGNGDAQIVSQMGLGGRAVSPMYLGAFEPLPIPAAPTNASATATGVSVVQVNWAHSGVEVDGFTVQIAPNGGPYQDAQSVAASARSATLAGLSWHTLYRIRVLAQNASGQSAPSGTVEAVTWARIGGSGGGRVEAEHYEIGGQNVSYFDSSAGNAFGFYRTNPSGNDVDVREATGTASGFEVGSFNTGEWLHFTVDVTTAGQYDVTARGGSADPATGAQTKSLALRLGTTDLGTLSLGETGNGVSQTSAPLRVTLPAGAQTLRVGATNGNFLWLDHLQFTPVTSGSLSLQTTKTNTTATSRSLF